MSSAFTEADWAPALPVIAAAVFLVLLAFTHVLAVSAGHCDSIRGGSFQHISVPMVSLSTRLPPESWIWTSGVLAVWLLLLCPTFLLTWEVLSSLAGPGRRGYHVAVAAEALLVVASVGLVGEACIRIQPNILVEYVVVNAQTRLHLVFAAGFFMCATAHVALVVLWQLRARGGAQRALGDASLAVKLAVSLLLLLCAPGVGLLPKALLACCPRSVCGGSDFVRDNNFWGFRQRSIIVLIISFVASYAIDIRDLRKGADSWRRPGNNFPEVELAES